MTVKTDIYKCPECKGTGASAANDLPCWACMGGGDIPILGWTAPFMRGWLIRWAEIHYGDWASDPKRKAVEVLTRKELRQRVRLICERSE